MITSHARAILTGSLLSLSLFMVPELFPSWGAAPAFPGAEGFGTNTVGGRGGNVIEVTNLNVDGPGSFKQAVTASGPRIVVFKVGGTIDSTASPYVPQEIKVTSPYLTIAGQTAPGDGIMLKGITLRIDTHDVIIRGLRIRVGDSPGGLVGDSRDGIKIETGSSSQGIWNVVVDHNSVSWAVDENMSTWTYDVGSGPPIHDVTFSWNLIGEGLYCSIHQSGCHSKGLLVGDHSQHVTVHHNLFAHNSDRAPEVKGDTTVEIISNVVYNYKEDGFTGASLIGDWEGQGSFVNTANVIGNYYIAGLDWTGFHGVGFTSRISGSSRIYVRGNLGPYRTSEAMDDWVEVEDASSHQSLRSNTEAVPPSGVAVDPAATARTRVLQSAGATYPRRDPVDQRIVNDVVNGTGHIIDHPSDVGGWPTLAGGAAPSDSDHDGMPDEWETARGLNPNLDDSAQDRNGDGYTNIEEYVNGLFGAPSTGSRPPTPTGLRRIDVRFEP